MSELFSPAALDAQLKKLPDLPDEEAHVGVVAKDGDVGVEAEGSHYIGKGWSAAGSFDWMKQKGWAVVAGLGWKGKSK
jgi:hypothetical protein